MKRSHAVRWALAWALASVGWAAMPAAAPCAEPDPATYWDVRDVRPGMKGVGRTVMVGTKLEDFQAEVLGVMRDVSPGRDMILCRLSGLNLEHAGIIQGMSGSPIYIDGKLLGAVAYAWEFAKDPIAGVTPFGQMVQYVRSSDKRIAAEARDGAGLASRDEPTRRSYWIDEARLLPLVGESRPERAPQPGLPRGDDLPRPSSAGGLAGMVRIATPLAASGFSPRALEAIGTAFAPLGMAPMAGGQVGEDVLRLEAESKLAPGSPLSIAMVRGDFDLSAIGTVTHVEGDRVYGFGHPMMGLGACEFPMMTGYIHTVYPRASVSMKMGSPLRVVGVLDTDVSTGIAGTLGPKPDLLPMSVTVRTGKYADPRTYRVELVRHPKLLSGLVQAVLAGAVDTEGDLPDELTARIVATIKLVGRDPIVFRDTVSGPRFAGPMGPNALFGPVAALAGILARNTIEPLRIEAIECNVEIDSGRTTAAVESVRLASDRLEPGQTLRAVVTVKPFLAERQEVAVELPLPADLPPGNYEAAICDVGGTLRKRSSAAPHLAEPRTIDGLLTFLRLQADLQRSGLYLHVARPERGLAVEGQALPNLPGSVRDVLSDRRQTSPATVRDELIAAAATNWVVEGNQTLKFEVVRDAGLSLRE